MAHSQQVHRPPMRPVLEAYVTITAATYTARAGDRLIGVNRAGAVTVTLPTAQLRPGRCYTVKDESGAAATNNITVATEGAETIDGAATDTISQDYGSKTYYSDGSNWFTVPLLAVGSHTLASHSTRPHSALTGVGADDHHAQSHTLDSHTGTLQHEKGGLEADVSGGDGAVQIKAGVTTVIKTNTGASAAPSANNDSSQGYSVGSIWIDTTNDKAYICLDATAGAAVWTETTQAGGAGADKSVRVYNSAAQSIANDTAVILTFDTEIFDTDTMHSTVSNTGRLTATTAGKYAVFAVIGWAGNATGMRSTNIRLNGTIVAFHTDAPGATSERRYSLATLLNLAANDYVDITVHQTSGGALNVAGGQSETNFSMAKVMG